MFLFAGNLQKTLFSKEQEQTLCNYIRLLENQLEGFSGLDIRGLAYDLAEKYKLPHRFKKENELAGEDWLRGFLNRHPEITLKKRRFFNYKMPSYNKEDIYKLINTFEILVDKHKLKANNIYTLDETTIPCIARVQENVDDSDSGTVSSENKLVTAEICFSASGTYLPLMLIFPYNDKSLLNGAPPGSKIEFDPMGQMQVTLFLKWLKVFIKFSKASKSTPVVLIVNKYQHILKVLEVLEMLYNNGINILCFPTDVPSKLYPMNHYFMDALRLNYTMQTAKWSKNHQDEQFTIKEVYELFGNAFMNVATIAAPVESFYSTGIWPIDRVKIEENLNCTENSQGKLNFITDILNLV